MSCNEHSCLRCFVTCVFLFLDQPLGLAAGSGPGGHLKKPPDVFPRGRTVVLAFSAAPRLCPRRERDSSDR